MTGIAPISAVSMPRVAGGTTTWPQAPGVTTGSIAGSTTGSSAAGSSGDIADRVRATADRNPLGAGGIEGAIDLVSGSISFDPTLGAAQRPVPGSEIPVAPDQAITSLPPAAAATMSTPDFLARAESSLAQAHGDMVAGAAQGASVGYAAFASELDAALRPDASGRNAFDHKRASLDARLDEVMHTPDAEFAGGVKGKASAIDHLVNEIGLTEREREKFTLLRKLVMSLLMGVQVSKSDIRRLIALGLGSVATAIISSMVGSGKGLTTSMHRQVAGLSELGVSVSLVPEQDTDAVLRQSQFDRALQARIGGDGRLVDKLGSAVSASQVGGDLASAVRSVAASGVTASSGSPRS